MLGQEQREFVLIKEGNFFILFVNQFNQANAV